MVIGHVALDAVSNQQLTRIIGLIVLTLLAVDFWRNRQKNVQIPTQWWFAAFIGILAGTATMLAHAAGPLMMIYFLSLRLEKHEFMGTGAWFFLVVNCAKIPSFWDKGMITSESLQLNLLLLPAVALGLFSGIYIFKKLPHKWFVIVVKTLTLAAAVRAFVA